jgi:hypothetical protein
VNWILVRDGADAQDMPLWIAQNVPRPKKNYSASQYRAPDEGLNFAFVTLNWRFL